MADEMIVKELDQVVVRFSGDSGDGMQLAGNIFSNISATAVSYTHLVALILLMIYMCAMYGLIPGMVANCALVVNLSLIHISCSQLLSLTSLIHYFLQLGGLFLCIFQFCTG